MDGILLINKPAGYTSHDIVGIVRKKLHGNFIAREKYRYI